MSHRLIVTKPRTPLGSPWVIRKTIYAVVTLIGVAAVVLGWVQPDQVDQWVAQAGSLAAIIGGGLATLNTNQTSDDYSLIAQAPATPPTGGTYTAYPHEVHNAD